MAATFRSRVFRLLLLFAAVPSVALTIIGYYLMVDQAPVSAPETTGGTGDLQDYFYNLLYEDIERALAIYEAGDVSTDLVLDFIVRSDSIHEKEWSVTGNLTSETVQRLLSAAASQERGLVAIGDGFHQFAALRTDAGDVLVGGVVHDSSLTSLLETARRSSATDSAERELRGTYAAFLGLLFLSITVLAILAAYVFSSRVSKNLAEPVIALSDASQRIAAGDFDQKVSLSAEDEIGTLITNFNRMAAQLDQATSRLAQTERVAAWRQVARRFAHELKNPLQPILVSLFRIEKQLSASKLWDEVKDPLRAASEEVKHLTVLAERFSSLAKLPPPSIRPLNLSDLVASTVELYREKLAPFKFELRLPETSVTVKSDAGYVREALHNLLQNSIDACQPSNQIIVELIATADTAEITVSDSGMGMDQPTLSSARLPYFTTKAKGSGLGLAVVERSMAELGGQLRVESVKNEGTVVAIVLPREKA